MAYPGFNPVNYIFHDKYLANSNVTKGVILGSNTLFPIYKINI